MTKGITFRGETFEVPETHDMVKTLLDPTSRKSVCEIVILILLFANGLVFLFVQENKHRIQIFIGLYIFWRLCYNFGIGYLLNQQSNRFRLVEWSKKLNLFSQDLNSALSHFVQKEVNSQMGKDYVIEDYPVAFNTWLIFRKVVDLILMLDFTAFICLFVACSIDDNYQFLHGQPLWVVGFRLVTGVSFILFNLWVKVMAHNTIKDYAWYWGDFFFRQINNEDLIFDGVFEMFPHPMYSVGYIGYYGFALIAKSYTVLIVAVFGHFLQQVFLHFIENPHIDKIYGPLPNESSLQKLLKLKDLTNFDNAKPLVGLANFNIMRASDTMNLIIVLTYAILIPFLTFSSGSNAAVGRILFYLAVIIKTSESVAINLILAFQSQFKTFTKWYLSNNIPVESLLKNFAVLYNSFINLTYSSFIGMNIFKVLTGFQYHELLFTDYVYLRVFLGALLVLTQLSINTSIIDLIGYFGWFYGDFFIPKLSFMPQRTHLTKAGVYRYLNNPEQIFGVCGVMGVTLVLPTIDNIVICFLWVANNFIRINFIEQNHMIKIYGEEEVFQDSGVTKTVKKHLLPEGIQKRLQKGDNQKRQKSSNFLIESFDNFIKDLKKTTSGFTKQNIADLSQNKHFAHSDYRLEIEDLHTKDSQIPYSIVGEPIHVKFTASENHSPKDWVGVYKIVHTSYSRYRTLVSSNHRWEYTGPESQGDLVFNKGKLPWEEGIYEFRYHIDEKHDVAFITQPFELKYPQINVPASSAQAGNLANELRDKVFEKLVDGISDNDTPIYDGIVKTNDVVDTYTRIALLIGRTTGIKVSKRFLIYNDHESGNKFTVYQLAEKLISINNALHELVEEETSGNLQEKKTQ